MAVKAEAAPITLVVVLAQAQAALVAAAVLEVVALVVAEQEEVGNHPLFYPVHVCSNLNISFRNHHRIFKSIVSSIIVKRIYENRVN